MSSSYSTEPPRIRYSGDLELRLSFDQSPLTRPSNNLSKEANEWFEEAKQRTLDRMSRRMEAEAAMAAISAEAAKYPPPPRPEQAKEDKKLRGPRPIDSSFGGWYGGSGKSDPYSPGGRGTGGYGTNTIPWKDAPFYKQPRCWVAIVAILTSLATFSLLLALQRTDTPTSVVPQSRMMIAAAGVSALISVASIGFYIVYPLGYGQPFRVADGVFSSIFEACLHAAVVALWILAFMTVNTAANTCRSEISRVAAGGNGDGNGSGNDSQCVSAMAAMGVGGLAALLMVVGFLARVWEIATSGMIRRWRRR
ncbi:hypothetical protein HK104_004367 [Borealophlyctis nickersoniae]|nr:hypothetical protein HK104_004367 [Borealophlyctis nickersoniae]